MPLFALFFFGQWSELNVALIAVVAILGVLTLAVPYYSFCKILDETHEAMSERLARKVEPKLRGSRFEIDHLSEFATVNAAITADPPPVMTRRSAIAYFVVQATALATLVAKDTLQEHVSFLAHGPSKPATSTRSKTH